MRIRSVFLAVLIAGTIGFARASLEFSGYLISNSGKQFYLTDLDTGSKSPWLAIGDSFLGHVVVKFDEAEETLTLDQKGKPVVLRLKFSHVTDGRGETSAKLMIRVIVSEEGAFLLEGKSVDQLGLLSYFEELVRSGRPISLTILAPPRSTLKNAEATRKVSNTFSASGAKGSISIERAKPTN